MGTIYYLRTTNSDLSGGDDWNKVISQTSEGAETGISALITGKGTDTQYGYSPSGDPNDGDWPDGDWTVYVDVSEAMTSGSFLNVWVGRVNSSGALQEETQSDDVDVSVSAIGVKTFDFSGVTWSSGSTGDRIRIRFSFYNNAHDDGNVTIDSGDDSPDSGTYINSVFSDATIVSPTALAGTFSLKAPTVTGKALISPTDIELAGGLQTPVVTGKALISPTVEGATFTLPAPTVTATVNYTPTALDVSGVIQGPTVTGKALISPTVEGAIFALHAPAIYTYTIVYPTALTLESAEQAPTVTGKALISPTDLEFASAVHAPVVTGKALVSPTALTLISAELDPAVTGAALISPTVLTGVPALQDPAVTGAALVSPTALDLVSSILDPVVQGETEIYPTALILVLNLNAPTIEGIVEEEPGPTLPTPMHFIPPRVLGMRVTDIRHGRGLPSGTTKLPTGTKRAIWPYRRWPEDGD